MFIFITVILIILIVGINALVILKAKSAADPAVVFSVFFGAQMLLSLLLLQGHIDGIYFGFFWLLAGISAFALGSFLVSLRPHRSPLPERAQAQAPKGYAVYDSRAMNITLAALLLVSFTQPIIMVYRLGFSFADLFHLHTLLEINTAAASGRYVTHNFHTAAVTQVILVLVYLLPLIGGWNFIYSKKRLTRVLCICTVLPALLVLMTQNTKAAFIGSMLLFICSFITARLQKTGRFFKLTRKRLLMIIPAAAAFMLINYISFFLREGKVSLSLFKAINNKVFTYLLGQIPAFNHWFSTNTTAAAHTFGLKTFYAVPQALGLAKRAPGIYAEKFYNTNIYMAFRPLIEDFSSLGALLVLLAAGAVSGFCIERIRSGYARCLDLAFIAALYFYIFYAFITSPYSYVSYTLAAVLFLPYLLLMRRHIVLKRERL